MVGAVRARGSFSNSSRGSRYGSCPFALAVSIKLYSSALAVAPRGLPENNQFLPDHEWPDRLLAGVVVRRELRVIEIADQLRPLSQSERGSPCRAPCWAAPDPVSAAASRPSCRAPAAPVPAVQPGSWGQPILYSIAGLCRSSGCPNPRLSP